MKTQKIALCGMAGVGKTIMMKQLKKAAKDRKLFDCILTVHVGEDADLMVVQQSVAEFIGENLTETTKDTRTERLHRRFEKISAEGNKRILVILDDVWKKFHLDDIGLTHSLPNGFKLLLTTRDENVCTQMGVETSAIFKIDVLKDAEARKLFWETTGLVPDSDIEPDLHQIGEDIVKRCGGLPIAITTIASALRDNKEKDEWEDALSRLQNKRVDGYNIKAIFEISYKNLKEDDLKAIFILSGLFPEDYNIGKEDLLRYGWGLKLFQDVHTIAEARRRVNTCVNKLIRSNLLLKSDREGCVKMHDLVRDFVLSNFSNVKQASIVNHNSNVTEQLKEEDSYDRILLKCECMLELPVEFNHANLELLKLTDGDKLLKFPKEFYSRIEKLKIVSYENMHRPLLPHNLTNLRALSLRSCSLVEDDISSIGDLVNLEVLSIVDCGIYKLPSRIGKLRKLKLLDLTGCANLCIDNDVLQNLEKLEELYMGVSKGSTSRFTEVNCTTN
ncbi:putative P-loop containing nucleoside triphosphate hydrolase, leucine-rich repeat domain superfamily [Helianthus anomalus]